MPLRSSRIWSASVSAASKAAAVSSSHGFKAYVTPRDKDEADFARAVEFLIDHEEMDGVVNIASPNPLPNRDFMEALRDAWGMPNGLPAPAPLIELAAFFLRTESELVLKSRRVIPGRLLDAGFEFEFPDWPEAAEDLVRRWRSRE